MFCSKCGNTMPDGASVCPNCGHSSAPTVKFDIKALIKDQGLAAIILKLIAVVNLLITFILAICIASKLNMFDLSGFGGFLIVFLIGLVNSSLIYAAADISGKLNKKEAAKAYRTASEPQAPVQLFYFLRCAPKACLEAELPPKTACRFHCIINRESGGAWSVQSFMLRQGIRGFLRPF